MDRADKSLSCLRHLTTDTENQREHAQKVKLVAMNEHNVESYLSLFTMTEDHEVDANYIVETFHRFISRKQLKGPLPQILFVKLDNCIWDKKIKFLTAYMKSLVAPGVFS